MSTLTPHFNFPPTEQAPGARIASDGEMHLNPYWWNFVPGTGADVISNSASHAVVRPESICT
jgi:hypothetical protein